tara:strand:+ start:1229 stop:5368 length:4140 start_codon:yes stop_codon:yes gene_type:complete
VSDLVDSLLFGSEEKDAIGATSSETDSEPVDREDVSDVSDENSLLNSILRDAEEEERAAQQPSPAKAPSRAIAQDVIPEHAGYYGVPYDKDDPNLGNIPISYLNPGRHYDYGVVRGIQKHPDAELELAPNRIEEAKDTKAALKEEEKARAVTLKEDAKEKIRRLKKLQTIDTVSVDRNLVNSEGEINLDDLTKEELERQDISTQDIKYKASNFQIPKYLVDKEIAEAQEIIDNPDIKLTDHVKIYDPSPAAMYDMSTDIPFLKVLVPFIAERFGKAEALQKDETLEEFVQRALYLYRGDLSTTSGAIHLVDHLFQAGEEQQERFYKVFTRMEHPDTPNMLDRGRGEFVRSLGEHAWLQVSDPTNYVAPGGGALVGVALRKLAGKVALPKFLKYVAERAAIPSAIGISAGQMGLEDFEMQRAEMMAIDPEGTSATGYTDEQITESDLPQYHKDKLLESNRRVAEAGQPLGIEPTLTYKQGELEVSAQEYNSVRTMVASAMALGFEAPLAAAFAKTASGAGLRSVPLAGRENRKLMEVIETRKQADIEAKQARQQAEDVTEDAIEGQDYSYDTVRAIMDGELEPNQPVTLEGQVKVEIARKMDRVTRNIIDVYNSDPELPNINELVDLETNATNVVLRVTRKLLENPEDFSQAALDRALTKSGYTVEEYVKLVTSDLGEFIAEGQAASVSDAARLMQSKSTLAKFLKRMKDIDPAVDKLIDETFGKADIDKDFNFLTDLHKFLKRVNDETRALMTSMPATAMRNFASGLAIVSFGTAASMLETTLYHMGKGVSALAKGEGSIAGTQAGLANMVRDSFNPLAYLLDPKLAGEIAEVALKDNPNLLRTISRSLQETGERDLSKYTRYSNALNLASDVLIRRVLFAASIDKELRRGGTSLMDTVADGKSIPVSALDRGVETALKGTMAYMPRVGKSISESVAHHFVRFTDQSLIFAVLMPFPKFMVGALAMQLRYSPANAASGFSQLIYNGVRKAMGKEVTPGSMQRARQAAAEGIVGSAALVAAIHYRANNQGTSYNIVRSGNNSYDIRAAWPLGFYLFAADFIVKWDQGTLSNLEIKDYAEGLFGYGGRAGMAGYEIWQGMTGLAEAVRPLATKSDGWWDSVEGEKAGENLGKILMSYLGRGLTQGRIISDIERAFSKEEAMIKDHRQYESQGFGGRFVESFTGTFESQMPSLGIFGTDAPPRRTPTRAGNIYRQGTILKQFFGLTKVQTPTDYEEELKVLNIENINIYQPTRIGQLDTAVQGEIGEMLPRVMTSLINSERYIQDTQAGKKQRVLNTLKDQVVNPARIIAKAKLMGTDQGPYVKEADWRNLSANDRKIGNEYALSRYGMTFEKKARLADPAQAIGIWIEAVIMSKGLAKTKR